MFSTAYNRYKAFTLAEGLITLGIIGVVAALTLPILIQNYKKSEFETRFEKAASTVQQAVLRMSDDVPEINATYCYCSHRVCPSTFIPDFSKYLIASSVKDIDTTNLNVLGYKDVYFFQASKTPAYFSTYGFPGGAITLNDGTTILSGNCWYAYKVDFAVDVNGKNPPNKFGYDVFYFQIQDDNSVKPYPLYFENTEITEDQITTCCDFNNPNSCTWAAAVNNGVTCGVQALRNQDTYWKNLAF